MKKTRFSEEQMVTILREADTKPVPDVAKKHGVSAQTIDSWQKHFGSLEPSDVKRLRQLEQENGRLKKMVADRDLEIDVFKEITRKLMVGARVRRQQVAYTRSRGLSDRRACAVLSVARSTVGYPSRLAVRDAPALTAMRRLAAQYPRYGSRSDPDLPETRGARDEPRSHASALAPGGVAGPAAAPSAPGGHGTAPARRPPGATCGRTTSCSTPVRIGRRSNA